MKQSTLFVILSALYSVSAAVVTEVQVYTDMDYAYIDVMVDGNGAPLTTAVHHEHTVLAAEYATITANQDSTPTAEATPDYDTAATQNAVNPIQAANVVDQVSSKLTTSPENVDYQTTNLATQTPVGIITDVATQTAEGITTDVATQTAEGIITDVATQTAEGITTDVATQTAEGITTDVATQTPIGITTNVATQTAEGITTDVATQTPIGITTDVATQTTEGITTDVATQTPEATPEATSPSGNGQTFSGDATFYEVGLGACGVTNSDSELIAAMNWQQFNEFGSMSNGNPICGKQAILHYQDKSVTVTVQDKCPGCSYGSIDLSPAAFTQLADESAGRIQITWEWI